MRFVSIYLLCNLVFILQIACKSTGKNKEEVRIDFLVQQPPTDQPESDSSGTLLLRIKLMGSNTDLIKYKNPDQNEQQKRLEYYMLQFASDIKLISETDTIPCTDSHMEQMYMDLPYRTFVLNFGNRIIRNTDQLFIRDLVFTDKMIVADINRNAQ